MEPNLHMLNNIFLTLLFAVFSNILFSQDWEKYENSTINQEGDIKIFYRYIEIDNFKYLEFRGEAFVPSSLSTLIGVIRDVDNMHNWVYNVDSAKSHIISETERFTYIVHKQIGFIFKRRDSYVHSSIQQDQESLTVLIKGVSAPDKKPKRDGYTRIEKGESKWELIPITRNKTKVIFQGYADPGGILSSSLLSPLAKRKLWKLPFFSLRGLKEQSRNLEYANLRFPFITDKK